MQQHSPGVHRKALIIHCPMFIFRQLYDIMHLHWICAFVELRIDGSRQIADEWQILCRMLFGPSILCIREFIRRDDISNKGDYMRGNKNTVIPRPCCMPG